MADLWTFNRLAAPAPRWHAVDHEELVVHLECGDGQFVINATSLTIRQGAVDLMSLSPCPVPRARRVDLVTENRSKQVDGNHAQIPVTTLGLVHIAVREGHVC